MNSKLRFALNFLRHPIRNASVITSSSFASKAMLRGIDFGNISVVVELGPGTGVFTEEILKRCTLDTKVILIEVETSYIQPLREKFGRKVVVEQASADEFSTIVAKYTDRPA